MQIGRAGRGDEGKKLHADSTCSAAALACHIPSVFLLPSWLCSLARALPHCSLSSHQSCFFSPAKSFVWAARREGGREAAAPCQSSCSSHFYEAHCKLRQRRATRVANGVSYVDQAVPVPTPFPLPRHPPTQTQPWAQWSMLEKRVSVSTSSFCGTSFKFWEGSESSFRG